MKITVSLPNSIFHSAERLAARLGLSRSELYRRAIEILLLRYDQSTITSQLDAVHSVDGNQPGLDPKLAVLQSQAIRSWAGR
jgi:metal-responsive CopG/Arc/MetJ family transcriptional regulator